MFQYRIRPQLAPFDGPPAPGDSIFLLVTSEELAQGIVISGAEELLRHTPPAQGAQVCKAEAKHGYLCGTIVTPKTAKNRHHISFGYLLAPNLAVLCDDTGTAHSMIQHIRSKAPQHAYTAGGIVCEFLELLISKDLLHLEKLEDELALLEDQALAGHLEGFNSKMTGLRKEIVRWIRYYTQLGDLSCEFQENENGYFQDNDLHLLHIIEKRIERLLGEAQSLREYGIQVRELFQAEIGIRQNQIMKTLTIVTTIFLPLSLVAGWYGMNFSEMPELTWKYGYPVVIGACILIGLICLWIMRKKKFW